MYTHTLYTISYDVLVHYKKLSNTETCADAGVHVDANPNIPEHSPLHVENWKDLISCYFLASFIRRRNLTIIRKFSVAPISDCGILRPRPTLTRSG